MGSSLALAPARWASSAAARTAMNAAVIGVLGVVGTVAVAGSLDRLTTSPARYGEPGDAAVADVVDDTVARLAADGPTAAVTADTRKGSIGFGVLAGRLPARPGEVALGPDLRRRLGARLGGRVALGAEGNRGSAVVVGEALAVGDSIDYYHQVALPPRETFDLRTAGKLPARS